MCASSHRLAQHLFHPQSPILDRNAVNRAVNCAVNSISDDSQEIPRLRACTLAFMSDACLCLLCMCERAPVMSFGAEVQRKTADPGLLLPGDLIGGVLSVVNR